MNIRLYQQRDTDDVIDIFRSNIPKYFGRGEEAGLRDFLAKFPDDYFVAELDGEVVGAGGIAFNDIDSPTVSLCWGMVREDFLGKGLGRELTRFRIELARDKYPGLPITIGTSQHTRGFYEKFGFQLVEHTPNGFGPGIDNCRMRLE